MSLLDHVDGLRRLAQLEGTSVLMMALLNVLEDLAVEVDRLVSEHPRPPEPPGGVGSI
jgi:hypothetical protein